MQSRLKELYSDRIPTVLLPQSAALPLSPTLPKPTSEVSQADRAKRFQARHRTSSFLPDGQDQVSTPTMSGQLPTFLSLGGENLGKGKSGSVAEAPSAPVRYPSSGSRMAGQGGQGSFDSLWHSIRGKKVKEESLTAEWTPNEKKITSPQSRLSPVWRGLYGLDMASNLATELDGRPGQMNLGFSFPATSNNRSQQSLQQQKSFLNMSHAAQATRMSRQGGQSTSLRSAGSPNVEQSWLPSSDGGRHGERFRSMRNMPTSSSVPQNLSSQAYNLSGSNGGRLRSSESTPDLRYPVSGSMARRPSAATTNDIHMPRRQPPPIPNASQGFTSAPQMTSRDEHYAKAPANRTYTNKWTTSSQLYPPVSRWMTAGACEQFVLPRPKLVAHPVSPPGSPDKEDRVVVIGNQFTRMPSEEVDASVVPVSEGAKVMLAIGQQKAERERWVDIAQNGRGARFRSLSLGQGSSPNRDRRSSISTGTTANTKTHMATPSRSRAGSLGHLFSSRRNPSKDEPSRAIPARAISNTSLPAVSPVVANGVGFVKGGSLAGGDSHGTHPFLSAWNAPLARQHSQSASEEVTFRDAQHLGISPRKPIVHSASSPNLDRSVGPDHQSKRRQLEAEEDVVMIGRPAYSPRKTDGSKVLVEKPLPEIPSAWPLPTLQPVQRDLFNLSDSLVSSAKNADDDMPSLVSAALHPVSPTKSLSGGIDRERTRNEIQKAHQRQMAQRAFLPIQPIQPITRTATAPPQLSSSKSTIPVVEQHHTARYNAQTPEPLPVATAMALASRTTSSPRRKKSSIEEAVSRARMSGARSPTSPSYSEVSHYSHSRKPSNSSDHASILEAAGIVPAPRSPGTGHQVSPSMDLPSPLRSTSNSHSSQPSTGDDSGSSVPVFLGPTLRSSTPGHSWTTGTSESPSISVTGTSPGRTTPRHLGSLRQAAQKDKMLLGSPASTSGTSPGNSPLVDTSFDDRENFQGLFFSEPSREWGSPLTVSGTPPGKIDDHARSPLVPSLPAFKPPAGGVLSGLGFVDRDPRDPQVGASSPEEHSDYGEAENFAIEIATPVDVSARSQGASSPFMNLVDPAEMGIARLSDGETDPRRVLLGGKDEPEEETTMTTTATTPPQTFERQLSDLFSDSPALSFVGETPQNSSPEVGGTMNWRSSILETGSRTPVRMGTVSAQYPTQSSSPKLTPSRQPIRNRPSHSSIIPELGGDPCDPPTTPSRPSTPQRYSTTASTDDGHHGVESTRFSFISTFPVPPGLTPVQRQGGGVMVDNELEGVLIPSRGGLLAGHDLRHLDLQLLTASSTTYNVDGNDDEDEEEGDPHSNLAPRPGIERASTEASTTTSFVTATEGYSDN